MPKAKNAKADEALALYQQGLELSAIAEILDVPVSTIRSWKHRYGWTGTSNATRCNKGAAKSVAKNVAKKQVRDAQVSAEKLLRNGLTTEQALFCVYFSKTLNATSAYQKAYGCGYWSAAASAHNLLKKPKIAQEVRRLKRERLAQAFLEPEDIFQKYMDIAFADISDYLEWGREEVPVMSAFGPVKVENPETGESEELTKIVNTVRFKESAEVDGTLISEVKQGREGVSIKLADRMKALDWLAEHMDLATPEQKAKTEKLIAETERLRSGQGSDDDDLVLQFIEGMRHDKPDEEAD